jgi:8-oxo-dGTP pyrophosphatase MutT (NUDIX family)
VRLDDIRRAFAAYEPLELASGDARRAAVAMVLANQPEGPSVLFIERASHPHDPWSGHMAFPGGRVDPGDAHAREAAERETLEEVGLSLRGAERIGRLDDKQGNPRTQSTLLISGYVYALPEPASLVLNHEVREAFWFPLAELTAPARLVAHRAHTVDFPGILVGEPQRHVVWGLTYSFLESFFRAVGQPLPNRWTPEQQAYARGMDQDGALSGSPSVQAGQARTGSGG